MLDDRQILNYVGTELQQSAGGNENDFIDANRQKALATYLGQPNGKEVEGRSTVTSTDVADAIEWIMPEIVKAFTQNNEVVTFDAVGGGDEDQALLESKYVYDILMKDNEGFLVIHEFIKDALMQKNGFLKVYYEEKEINTTESYTGLTDMELNIVLSDPNIEMIEQTTEQPDPQQPPSHDIKVRLGETESKIKVVCVPPEEFRVDKQHPSLCLKDARFTAHVVLKTAGELIEEGHTKEFVDTIPSSNVYEDDREYRFYMQDETVYPDRDNSLDPSLRTIEIAECYMRMDYDEDGIAELVKVEVAGGDNPDVLLSIEEIDEIPFISSTAILMSHKLFGLSIYDRLREIQEQKTTLWRNIFDNMYLQNNQRTIVVENQVNLDDLMVNRPGGIIRAKRLDAVMPYQTPPLSGDSYKMMDYLDQVRSSRSGVSPEGPVTDSMIGDRVGSEGVEKMMSQKEELVGLMIRVIAETGIKPLCYMIRSQAIRHQNVPKDYNFKGRWVPVDPRSWRKRPSATVRVGTGSGNRKEQQGAVSQIMMIQEKIMANGSQALVTDTEIFSAVDDFARFSGMPGASKYFLDPKSPEGQENKKKVDEQNQQMQQMQQEMEQANAEATQKIAQAEVSKAEAAMKNVDLTAQNNQMKTQLEGHKVESTNEISFLKQQLEEAKTMLTAEEKGKLLDHKYYDTDTRAETERMRIHSQERIASANQSQQSEDNE